MTAVLLSVTLSSASAQAIDVASLWDFSRPNLSEERFRAALAKASGDDALILQTQIARSYGLRRDFAQARSLLVALQPHMATAGAEAQVRFQLEWGRSWASAVHAKELLTPEALAQTRAAYEQAWALAKRAMLDGLAIDAIHMFAFIDTSPADQLRWAQEALALAMASEQPAAKRWEASVRNNLGYALHQLGRYGEALDEFRQALTILERGTNLAATRSARWMVAWTLRALDRSDEAMTLQLALEREADAAQAPSRFVYEELELLYRAKGEVERAQHYAVKAAAIKAD